MESYYAGSRCTEGDWSVRCFEEIWCLTYRCNSGWVIGLSGDGGGKLQVDINVKNLRGRKLEEGKLNEIHYGQGNLVLLPLFLMSVYSSSIMRNLTVLKRLEGVYLCRDTAMVVGL